MSVVERLRGDFRKRIQATGKIANAVGFSHPRTAGTSPYPTFSSSWTVPCAGLVSRASARVPILLGYLRCQGFDNGNVLQQLGRQTVPLLQIVGAVIRNPDFSFDIYRL